MSIARHHAEWLSLLEVSGPFLSMPALLRAFPQGLDAHDPAAARDLRLAYGEWQGRPRDPALHTAWTRFVLSRLLDLPPNALAEGQALPPSLKAVIAEQGEVLRPDLAVVSPADGRPQLLLQVYPATQDLDRPAADRRWKASPATRMMELLHAVDVRLGLVTNGERWMLVDAPRGGTTGFISWYAALWLEEPLTLRAFRSLLGARRFFAVAEAETLAKLLEASADEQHEVTDQLGYQVRRAVEVLVRAMDRADQDAGRRLLADVTEPALYEAALTVMMRLVFLFSAEERGLLLLGDPLYDQHYAVSTLRAQLREAADQHGEEVLERRHDAWPRLLATFRAVHAGAWHQDLRLPAYGGSLFDPARFPFLEGHWAADDRRPGDADAAPVEERGHPERSRAAAQSRDPRPGSEPLLINNRTILHLLEALQILQVKVPGGGPAEARRLSFRALDIEQIGHVYEGLLDHTAVRAGEWVLGLTGTKDREPEVALARLETLQAQGRAALLEYLREQTGRSESALKKALVQPPDDLDHARLRAACGNDDAVYRRLLSFAGLVREDDLGYPVVIAPGSVYVTAGADRRSSGTHYTPRSLTEPIVARTLEPLIYRGPAEGAPKDQWQLKPPADLLALKVCDMAMGSGAFLVQTCRFLSERLVEAWETAESEIPTPKDQGPRPKITPDGKPALGEPGEQLIPDDAEERLAFARRLVADRCLYGVDKNPLAVEMAKLSLWLITLSQNRPFTFLDHALKSGDSLVGADEAMFTGWARSLLAGKNASAMTLFDEDLRAAVAVARAKRRELESFEVRDVRDAERKAALLKDADIALRRVKLGCDLLVGVRLLPDLSKKEREQRLSDLLVEYTASEQPVSAAAGESLAAAQKAQAFHWPFEFPEVFERGGFSAYVGNPPFIGGRRIRESLGDQYRDALYGLFQGSSGNADYSAFFFLRGYRGLRRNGTLGLIATNTIAQGDTRRTGLDNILKEGGTIYAATNNMLWPGAAAVVVSVVHITRGLAAPPHLLDGRLVDGISSLLNSGTQQVAPLVLFANQNKSHIGSLVHGTGFTLEAEAAQALTQRDARNKNVLFPYLGGEDLNTAPDQIPSRWVINFFDWPIEAAENYPDCFDIVRRLVKPHRDEVKRKAYRDKWWQYAEKQQALYRAIARQKRAIAVAVVSKTVAFAFVPVNWVFAHKVVVFPFDDGAHFAVLQSSLHYFWAWKYSSTMKTDLNYSPTDCFQTFPFPQSHNPLLDALGETYHDCRRQLMLVRQEGLTKVYNRLHDPQETSADIAELRRLHVEMDHAVAAAYGWQDLDLGHGFHETAQGVRYTLSELARREVLARLLHLNHERYEEEVRQGLHDKGKGKKAAGGEGKGAPAAKRGRKKKAEDGPADGGQLGMF